MYFLYEYIITKTIYKLIFNVCVVLCLQFRKNCPPLHNYTYGVLEFAMLTFPTGPLKELLRKKKHTLLSSKWLEIYLKTYLTHCPFCQVKMNGKNVTLNYLKSPRSAQFLTLKYKIEKNVSNYVPRN